MSGSLATLPTGADRHGGTAASTKIHELGATPLDEADEGEFELVTSTVSQVEVDFGKDEQDSSSPDPTVLSAIEAFWVEGAPVRLIEFHRLIGLDARDLVRIARLERGERLTPLDAIHLASANGSVPRSFTRTTASSSASRGQFPLISGNRGRRSLGSPGWREYDG